jgi:hypothetical protein
MATFDWQAFLQLTRFSIEFLGFFSLPTAVAVSCLVIGAIWALKVRSPFPRLGLLWSTVPFLLALVPLVLGTVFWSPTPPPERIPAPPWAFNAVDAMWVVQLVISVAAIWGSKGWRIFAVGVMVLQGHFLEGASFMAGMAMTGEWL